MKLLYFTLLVLSHVIGKREIRRVCEPPHSDARRRAQGVRRRAAVAGAPRRGATGSGESGGSGGRSGRTRRRPQRRQSAKGRQTAAAQRKGARSPRYRNGRSHFARWRSGQQWRREWAPGTNIAICFCTNEYIHQVIQYILMPIDAIWTNSTRL